MLLDMTGKTEVGIYSAAVRLSEVWYFIPAILVNSVMPAIIMVKNRGIGIYHTRLQQLHDILVMLALIIAVGISSLAPFIIEIAYGRTYARASDVLVIHVWACLAFFPGAIRGHYVVIEKMEYLGLIWRGAGAVLNVALNYILIPKYSAVGAAWATLAALTIPVFLIALFSVHVRLTTVMTLKAFLLPIRAAVFRKKLYDNIC